jgi:hypothetical protein
MAKKSKEKKPSKTDAKLREQVVLSQVQGHYETASQETDRRRTGSGDVGRISFDEADELFRSWLDEGDWPYDALMFDPRVFTFIFEKTSRLISKKLRGHLSPREGGDVLGAHVNNELLSFQWDQANHGGSMIKKWSLMDINARKYGAAFGLCKWRYETKPNGDPLFDGPEFEVLNNRDCLPDPTATSIENCNWFQVRKFVTMQELERVNDQSRDKPIYKNMDRLKESINVEAEGGGDTRDIRWQSRNRQISKLSSDPYGQDSVFKSVEVVTEYRKDRWITFAPRYGILLRDIENPYENNELPAVMLRYYSIDDDLYGLSEIEPVKGLQKAINAILSQYLDEINQKLYSPIATGPGVKQHTLRWGKGARWQMNNPMTDFRVVESRSNAAQFFNNTYSVLVSAMMNALGESSLGISNIGQFQEDKTATEVRALVEQQTARDNYNQIYLSEALKRMMKLWYSQNQKMLFNDPEHKWMVVRIVGHEAIKYFQEAGLDDDIVIDETIDMVRERTLIAAMEGRSEEIKDTMDPEQFVIPKYPVETAEGEFKKKFEMDETGRVGKLIVEATDLKGEYDYVPDVESMSLAGGDMGKEGRNQAVAILLSNQNSVEYLREENVKPKFKELFITWLRDLGFQDADRYFEEISPEEEKPQMEEMLQQSPELAQPLQQQGGAPMQQPASPQMGAQGGGVAAGEAGGVMGGMYGSMGGRPPEGTGGFSPPRMPGEIVGG